MSCSSLFALGPTRLRFTRHQTCVHEFKHTSYLFLPITISSKSNLMSLSVSEILYTNNLYLYPFKPLTLERNESQNPPANNLFPPFLLYMYVCFTHIVREREEIKITYMFVEPLLAISLFTLPNQDDEICHSFSTLKTTTSPLDVKSSFFLISILHCSNDLRSHPPPRQENDRNSLCVNLKFGNSERLFF